jgi:hypothetical protein
MQGVVGCFKPSIFSYILWIVGLDAPEYVRLLALLCRLLLVDINHLSFLIPSGFGLDIPV